MMRYYPPLLATVAVLLSQPAAAASFDCSKARSPDEITVCRTPELSSRDSEMAALFYAYAKVPMMMGSNGARHDDAQAFLVQRAACGTGVACLRQRYAARIIALKAGIDGAMQELFRLQNAGPPSCAPMHQPG